MLYHIIEVCGNKYVAVFNQKKTHRSKRTLNMSSIGRISQKFILHTYIHPYIIHTYIHTYIHACIYRSFFAECGEISEIRWGEDKTTGDFKGYCHLEFQDSSKLDTAVALSGTRCV
jgi:hypothetical protein